MFENIYGNRKTVENLKNSIESDRVSHCYLFSGEKGLGKRTIAKAFAKALLCEGEGGARPCNKCRACVKVDKEEHHDLIFVGHEKPNTFGVEDIRDGLNRDIVIRPNEAKRKIYIIDDAELLNVQAQNAMLKTIEEPPEYAVIMLLSDNKESFLPTVLSRCVEFNMMSVKDRELIAALKEKNLCEEVMESYITEFAGGNIGRAIRLITDEVYREKITNVDKVLQELPRMGINDIREALPLLGGREDMDMVLSRMQVYFGNILKLKATDSQTARGDIARQYSYEDFTRIFGEIEHFRMRMKVNVNADLSLELLLDAMRPKA